MKFDKFDVVSWNYSASKFDFDNMYSQEFHKEQSVLKMKVAISVPTFEHVELEEVLHNASQKIGFEIVKSGRYEIYKEHIPETMSERYTISVGIVDRGISSLVETPIGYEYNDHHYTHEQIKFALKKTFPEDFF